MSIVKPLSLDCPLTLNRAVRDIASENPFLGSLISAMLVSYSDQRCRFRQVEAEALVRVLRRAGVVGDFTSLDFLDDPMVFWDFFDAARAEDPSGGLTVPLRGLWCLYQKASHGHVFPKEFVEHEKSIFPLIGSLRLLDIMGDRNVTRENYFAVSFFASPGYVGHPLVMDYRSPYLASRVARTMKGKDIKFYFHSVKRCGEFLTGFERWFEDAEGIRSFEDFTPQRLVAAISAIRAAFPGGGRECLASLKFLFWLWGDLMYDYPEHDFMKDSDVYTAETVLYMKTPNYLAAGYVVRVAGLERNLPADEKTLFLVHNDDLRTSRRHRYSQRAVDFTRISDPMWRKTVVNYAQENILRGNDQRHNAVMKSLVAFWKVHPAGMAGYRVSAADFRIMRTAIDTMDMSDASKAATVNVVRDFFRWSAQNGYITAQEAFWKSTRNFRHFYRPDPSSVSLSEIEALDQAFEDLGAGETRFLLDRCIMHIQLLTRMRAGQICAMMTGQLEFDEEGGCTAWQLTKTSGGEVVANYMSPEAAEWLREALDLSRPLRESCPAGGPKDYVFLYRNSHHVTSRYSITTVISYSTDLATACWKAGVRRLRPGNIRDTAMTARKKMARKAGLNTLETGAFVGHASVMSTNAYHDIDLRDVLQASSGLRIGSIRGRGDDGKEHVA